MLIAAVGAAASYAVSSCIIYYSQPDTLAFHAHCREIVNHYYIQNCTWFMTPALVVVNDLSVHKSFELKLTCYQLDPHSPINLYLRWFALLNVIFMSTNRFGDIFRSVLRVNVKSCNIYLYTSPGVCIKIYPRLRLWCHRRLTALAIQCVRGLSKPWPRSVCCWQNMTAVRVCVGCSPIKVTHAIGDLCIL